MIMHINLGTNDLATAEAFYTDVLGLLGVQQTLRTKTAAFYSFAADGSRLAINLPFDGAPATGGNGTMVALRVASPALVDRVHARAIALGATSEGEPRDRRNGRIYAAYFRDFDGNKFGLIFPQVSA